MCLEQKKFARKFFIFALQKSSKFLQSAKITLQGCTLFRQGKTNFWKLVEWQSTTGLIFIILHRSSISVLYCTVHHHNTLGKPISIICCVQKSAFALHELSASFLSRQLWFLLFSAPQLWCVYCIVKYIWYSRLISLVEFPLWRYFATIMWLWEIHQCDGTQRFSCE